MTANLAAALVAAQKEMPAVDKTGKSNFGAHITLDHLIARTRPHIQKHGLTIVQYPAVLDTGQPALRTILLHESGESIQADAPLFLGEKHNMQELGKAITYARRYGWGAVLGISTEEDDDADSISQPKPKAAPKPKDTLEQLTPGESAQAASSKQQEQMSEYHKFAEAYSLIDKSFNIEAGLAAARRMPLHKLKEECKGLSSLIDEALDGTEAAA